jgi:hypothetical protein
MTSSFNVHDASGYEQLMGRWSKKLAPVFINFGARRRRKGSRRRLRHRQSDFRVDEVR